MDKLIKACEKGDLQKVKSLVEHGVIISAIALMNAIYYEHFEIVKYLIKNGADVHVNNDYLLRSASWNGYFNMVKFLVEHGANIHIRGDEPLKYASASGHLKIVKYLIEHGADIYNCNYGALNNAAYEGHLEVVNYLRKVLGKELKCYDCLVRATCLDICF